MPLLDRPAILVATLAYFALVIAIGLWSLGRTRTARDFFIAGQGLGIVVAGLATMTAAFSGFVFIGGPGLTYRIGIAALFICVPLGFTGGLLCWVVGERLREMAGTTEIYTVPDVFGVRFGSAVTRALAAITVLCGSVAYLAAQLLALAIVLEAVLGIGDPGGPGTPVLAMTIGVVIVCFYSVTGGMIAGVYTDLVQGVMMMVAAALVFLYALESGGGWSRLIGTISDSPDFGPRFLDPLGTVPVETALGFFFVFGIGVLGQPQMLHKFFMVSKPSSLRWMPLVLGFSQLVCVLIWLGIGLAVPALVASGRLEPLANADSAAPQFLLHFTPPVLAGLAVAGILAAIMSTADSFINLGAAAVVRDLPRSLGWRVRDELLWGRLASVCLAVAAALLAAGFDDLVALIGTFAFGTFAAGLAPALAVGLNWEGVTARAASASIAAGTIGNIGLELGRRYELLPESLMPSLAALALSFSVLLVVSFVDRGRSVP